LIRRKIPSTSCEHADSMHTRDGQPMRYAEVQPGVQAHRVESVDALRGFNFVWILGGDGIMLALGEMSRNKGPVVGAVGGFLADQLTHAPWEGLRLYDFVFPLFLFLTGVSIVLSLPRLVEREGRRRAHLRVLRRSLILFALGFVYYGGFTDHWDEVRVLGVLQRIAICYLVVSLLFLNVGLRGMIAACVVLLVGYWALMTFVPVPGIGAGSFAPNANLSDWIDTKFLPGHPYEETRDPEGLLSTLPAIASCLLGVFAGLLLCDVRVRAQDKSLWLIGAGIVFVAAGHLWALQFPIVKEIWTSSFAVVSAGYSAILLGVAHQLVDVWGLRRWSTMLVWIGTNAIVLYMANNLVNFAEVAKTLAGGDISDFLDAVVTPGAGDLAVGIVGLGLAIAFAGFLYRRKIFLRV
jgi:predicted acyltransferase